MEQSKVSATARITAFARGYHGLELVHYAWAVVDNQAESG